MSRLSRPTLRRCPSLLTAAVALAGAVLPTAASAAGDAATKQGVHKLFLKGVEPAVVLQRLGWLSGERKTFPEGVSRVYPFIVDDSLVILSSDAGFERLKSLVATVDVAPRKVQIKVRFLIARTADVDAVGVPFRDCQAATASLLSGDGLLPVGVAAGDTVAPLFTAISKTVPTLSDPDMTTSDDTPVSCRMPCYTPLSQDGKVTIMDQHWEIVANPLTFWPHVNKDGTITLAEQPLSPVLSRGGTFCGTAAPLILRTLSSGDTAVMRIPLRLETVLLVFVTPTALDAKETAH